MIATRNNTEDGIQSQIKDLKQGPQDAQTEAEITALTNKVEKMRVEAIQRREQMRVEAIMKHCNDLRAKKVADLTVNDVTELKGVCGTSSPIPVP